MNKPSRLSTIKTGSRDIDVTFMDFRTADIVSNWEVTDEIESSDHRALIFTIGGARACQRIKKPRYNTKNADWTLLGAAIQDGSIEILETYPEFANDIDVEGLAVQVTNLLNKAARSTMKRKTCFQKSVPWWTEQLNCEKKTLNKLRRQYQEEKNVEARANKKLIYRSKRRDYSRFLSKTRNDGWKSFVEENTKDDAFGLAYKIARERLCVKTVFHSISDKECGSTVNWADTAEALLNGLFSDPSEEDKLDMIDKRGELTWVRVRDGMAMMY